MNTRKNYLIIYISIFTLLFFLLLFFVFNKNKQILNETNSWVILTWWLLSNQTKSVNNLVITVITDKRNPETNLSSFIENLKLQNSSIKNASFKNLDFSDDSVKAYMKKNNINKLPAIIFSKNDFDTEKSSIDNNLPDIKNFLSKMESWEYYLEIWAVYNPFNASDRWFQVLDKNVLNDIKSDSIFVWWDNSKKIIWLEYSDLSCIFCRNFNNSWIIKEILNKNKEKISKTYNHFIAHKSQDSSFFSVLECINEKKWWDLFFSFIENSFKKSIFDKELLIKEAVSLWLDKKSLEDCVSTWVYNNKILNQDKRWSEVFGVLWTPTNVFINQETLEYKTLSWFDEENMKNNIENIIKELE